MFIVSTAAPVISQPSISLINVTPTSLTVSLDTPAVGPTPITFYSVQVFNTLTNGLIESFAVQPTSFPFLITGLTNGTSYTVTVTGIESTQNVYASPSILRQATTGSTASPPPQVTGLTATATGQTTIQLSWTADPTATSYTIMRTGGLSPSGTTISGPGASIVDANGNTWTLGTGVGGPNYSVYMNGATAGVSYSVILLLYYNTVIYQENASGQWFNWTGTNWASIAGDPRGTTTAPAPAAAVGYTVRTLNSTTWNNTTGPWYSFNAFGNTEPAGSIVQNSDGTLNLGQGVSNNYGICSTANDTTSPHKWHGKAYGPGYFRFQATITFASGFPNGSQPTATPGWANTIKNQSGGYTPKPTRWGEIDGNETNQAALNKYGIAFHDWSNPGGNGASPGNTNTQPNIGSPVTFPTGGLLSGTHWYGWRWIAATAGVPGSGSLGFYLDDVLVGTPLVWDPYNGATIPASGSQIGSILDTDCLSLIAGGIANSWVQMHAIEGWQTSDSVNITS